MDWRAVCGEMLEMLRRVYGANHMIILFLAVLVWLWFVDKPARRMVVYPSLILTILLCNPVCYAYIWTRLMHPDYYWRVFWLLPVIPVTAYACIRLIARADKREAGAIAAVICLLVITRFGSNVYAYQDTAFREAENTFKLPQAAIEVSDALLEMDDHPHAVIDGTLNCYIRQYTTRIHMLYGRDAGGYIADIDKARKKVVKILSEPHPDLRLLYKRMEKMDYPWYVRCNDKDVEIGPQDFLDAGFQIKKEIGNYTIYRIAE